ncbi:hypothetical protein [Dysosmobacter sp.]|jgi:hypothetical protein|uniref:hypothetical protein n=1 Tax=Dysosmobacter sp. TaxID=2591382 RepID=UPI003D8BB0BD
MQEDNRFYEVYQFGDKLQPGERMQLEHHISFRDYHADLAPLVSQPLGELCAQKEASIKAEQAIFEKLKAAMTEWETQAAQTLILGKAIEYVRTPQVQHTQNQWQEDTNGWHERSNLVYKMSYQIYENTAYNSTLQKSVPVSYQVTWNLYFNNPSQSDYNGTSKVDGQERKKYPDKDAAQRYVQGRIAAYDDLFTELSPPIPENRKRLFSVNGHLLPGYTLQPHQPTPQELLAFLEDKDVPLPTPKPKQKPRPQHGPER